MEGRHGNNTTTGKVTTNQLFSSIKTDVFSLNFLFYRVGESRDIGTKGCLNKER